ncbi:MAG: 16S rRNA (guanine(966)-N(2))-methyltransferase RsmD [Bdellovibrionales bacterium]|nr:16S rRNA (guanine(966)-N(2))-methyltransferase RsmD [Bdellovibrionales bacterium]
MRIISGSLKGRRLKGFDRNLPLRPMTDRVKESLFAVLTPFFHKDLRFLDLFSGTGSLSMEALSRGAKEAHAVEFHPRSLEIIKRNRQILPCPENLILYKQKVFSFLNHFKGAPFDIVVADPPFSLNIGHLLLEKLSGSDLCTKKTIIAIETGKRETLQEQYNHLKLFSKKTFGDKQVRFYEFR